MANSIIRVGGANALDPTTGLPMFRQYMSFEANNEHNFIKVTYNQWLESPIGNRIEIINSRTYYVVDQPEIGHTIPAVPEVGHFENTIQADPEAVPPVEFYAGDWVVDTPAVPEEYVVDTPAYPMFTGWNGKLIKAEWVDLKLGDQVVSVAINNTLQNMAFNVYNEHKVTPS